MDILKCINNGSKHIVWLNLGKSFDKYVEEGLDEYILLVSNAILLDCWSIERLMKQYYIHELVELSNCYLGTFNTPYVLWHISKQKPTHVKTAIFYNYAHDYRDNNGGGKVLRIPDEYNEEFHCYIKSVEEWIASGKMPSGLERCEFNAIPIEEFEINRVYPRYYKKANNEIRFLLKEADVLMLNDVAEISKALPLDGGNNITRVRSLDRKRSPMYPYFPEQCAVESFITSEILHKGDIVKLGKEFFLVDKESEFELYAPLGAEVIRAKSVIPEYLFFYLNSETAKRIEYALRVQSGEHASTSLSGALEKFPVLIPEKEAEYYVKEFAKVAAPNKRYYEKMEIGKPQSLEEALSLEVVQKIRINGEELLKKQIKEDIEELNVCFNGGAYKATLVLAGSIMEAILIDWLSEIKGIDYFTIDLKKRKYDKTKKCYVVDSDGEYIYIDQNADLLDYINEIRDIKRPTWMKESVEAHEIRKKRNLVHAKLCLKESVQIDEDICGEVIRYLKNIIESRWK